MKAPRKNLRLLASTLLWLVLVVMGMTAMALYENTPGPVAATPRLWPEDTRLSRSRDRFTAVVFVHPQCPCTSATLDELERVLTHEAGRIETIVAVVTPPSKVEEWRRTRITRLAARIPEVALYTDVGGREARRFGAMTSGFTVLYAADGRLRFAGGITASRGEAGDNLGAIAIEDVVEHRPPSREGTKVFGCELHDPPAQTGGQP